MKLANAPEQILSAYLESRRHYVGYYLKYPKHTGDVLAELEVELPNLQHAFSWTLEAGDNKLIPEFWNDVKDFLWDHGHWQTFIDWGEGTLKAIHELKSPEIEAWVLSELGWFWMEQSEFAIAQEMFERSKDIFTTIDDHKGICAIDRYLGVLAYRMEDFNKTSTYYEMALQLATIKGYAGMIAEIRNLQGSLARKMEDFTQARQFYEEARKEIEQLGDKWRLTGVLRNLAHLELQLGELLAAKDGFMRAMALCEQIDRKDMLYGCQLGLAEVELKLGDVQKAGPLALAARNGFAKLGMKRDVDAANQFLIKLSE